MPRLPVWTIVGVLLALWLGTLHALTLEVLELRSYARTRRAGLFPRGWAQW